MKKTANELKPTDPAYKRVDGKLYVWSMHEKAWIANDGSRLTTSREA